MYFVNINLSYVGNALMFSIFRNRTHLTPKDYANAAYRTVWRWHFYAGIFCIPFVVILSVSGAVYLFKPQIDKYYDKQYDGLAALGSLKPLDLQVDTVLRLNPSYRLKNVELSKLPENATRMNLISSDGEEIRVLIRPDTLEILNSQPEKSRLTTLMHDLHGELFLGEPGAVLLELAGAWAIVMVITGIYLWWPKSRADLGGVLYPRTNAAGGFVYRDLHAVFGFWISLFLIFFLISGLPWTRVWGETLKYARSAPAQSVIKQDWTTGPASEQRLRLESYDKAIPSKLEDSNGEHAEHHMLLNSPHDPHLTDRSPSIRGFDEIADRVRPIDLAEPILMSPPSAKRPAWVVMSNSQNRPLRRTIEFDPDSYEIIKDQRFSDRPLLDRIIGYGVAIHEGQFFGLANQILGLMVAVALLVMMYSATLMWLRKGPKGTLGAPPPLNNAPKLSYLLLAMIAILGLFLPTLGLSLILVLILEALIAMFLPHLARKIGIVGG